MCVCVQSVLWLRAPMDEWLDSLSVKPDDPSSNPAQCSFFVLFCFCFSPLFSFLSLFTGLGRHMRSRTSDLGCRSWCNGRRKNKTIECDATVLGMGMGPAQYWRYGHSMHVITVQCTCMLNIQCTLVYMIHIYILGTLASAKAIENQLLSSVEEDKENAPELLTKVFSFLSVANTCTSMTVNLILFPCMF